MATATAERLNWHLLQHCVGPFDVYDVARHEHQPALTLGQARDIAVHDSMESGCQQVLSADLTVVGWASHGQWHGPEAA